VQLLARRTSALFREGLRDIQRIHFVSANEMVPASENAILWATMTPGQELSV
jgi:hypothetical protein